ncbi:uncharacterized protein LTR77_010348 [Saxophila tyrrhenica]|uniref:C2H2-type domain-containing protein n=1 Tax=Saxophila tyrrhenica TaxID=1690608 RepID=A0AAV9NWD0_9PEZI|nr:hypothetical protein LTR77_010348 [Saxophila tyrrhenica]
MTTHSHPASPTSSPSSPTASTTHRELKGVKDRNCPFCGQAFTSSSLGRHLDLYIKSKNPKPPDGVHDVHEIRRIRGGITRRQPRGSGGRDVEEGAAGKREGSSGATGTFTKREEEDVGEGARKRRRLSEGGGKGVMGREYVKSPVERDPGMQTWFNTANWQATGVINDLPARATSRSRGATPPSAVGGQAARIYEMRRDGSGNRIERPEHVTEEMWKLQETAEVGKAAEMALREVLGSLEAAKKKAEPKQLYEDFDFFALSFPGLCLAILPPPPGLFSTTPFAAAHTWALAPPWEKQYEALNRMMNERLAWLRNAKGEAVQDSVAFRYVVHMQGAWEHWQTMSEADRASAWSLEMSRAFVGEKGKKNDLRMELEREQQRVRHLEAEYERLSRCQLPREYLLHPPNTMPVPPETMRAMQGARSKSVAAEWDYDAEALLEKWKSVVKSTARPPKRSASDGPPHTQPYYVETQRNPMRGDMVMNGSLFGIGGPLPRDQSGAYQTPHAPGTAERYGEEMSRVVDEEGEQDGEGAEEVDGEGERPGWAKGTRASRNGRRLDAGGTNEGG